MNTLKSIALKRNFEIGDFIDFALRDSRKYGVDKEGGQIISKWYEDILILDYFNYKLEQENMRTLNQFRMEEIRKTIYQ